MNHYNNQTPSAAKEPRVSTGQTRATSKEYEPLVEHCDYTIHDYTTALKSALREMPQPLLTNELLAVFNSVADLTNGNLNKDGERKLLSPEDLLVARAKQLKAIRLLRLLLSKRNQTLLRRLLDRLTETLKHSEDNRMTSSSLGTLFGPLILAPADVSFTNIYHKFIGLIGFQ